MSVDQNTDDIFKSLPNGSKFAHINLCVLMNKLDQIKILLRQRSLDVLAVTESKLDSCITDAEIHINGYTVVRRDRNRHGGGVLLYIKDKWTVTNVCPREDFEMITVDIKLLNSPKITVGVVYRPPDSNVQWLHSFEDHMEDVVINGSEYVIMGDYNYDQLKTSVLQASMDTIGLEQIITEPTRVTKDTSTLIDHIYVNKRELYGTSGVIPIGLSDHHLIYAVRKKTKTDPKVDHVYIKYRDQKNLNENNFLSDLRAVDWSNIKQFKDVNSMWTTFKTNFMEVVDKHMPIKERRIRTDSEKWINDDILSEMRQRDYLHRKALKSLEESDWNLYKAARNRVVSKIKAAKREFVENAINQSNEKPKDMWDRLKEFLPSKSTGVSTSYMEVDGETIAESNGVADAFNNFFCGVGHKFAENFDNSMPEVEQVMPEGSFSIPDISVDFIKKEIKSMSNAKATGLDEISVNFLKMSIDVIGDTLAFMMNFSIRAGDVATEWKKARVTPLYKSGDAFLVNNYRPVSVLPVISKIIERHVFNSFYDYLNANHLLTEHQSGFRPKHSCETALHNIIDNWLCNIVTVVFVVWGIISYSTATSGNYLQLTWLQFIYLFTMIYINGKTSIFT